MNLNEYIESLGIRMYGYTNFEALKKYEEYYNQRPFELINPFEEINPLGKLKPLEGLEDLKNIIVFGFPYLFSGLVQNPSFSFYTKGEDYHRVVKSYLSKIANFIEKSGFKAVTFTDSNPLAERLMAYEAGLGVIGRNNLLINEEYGSYFFIGEILTDMNVDINDVVKPNISEFKACGSCTNCIKACPVGILGEEYCRSMDCLSYTSQKKELSDEEIQKLNGRLFGCDTCQIVCPLNKGKEFKGMDEFMPLSFMSTPDLYEIATLSKASFIKYKGTSAGWRGKSILQRNAMIALAKDGKKIPQHELKSDKLIKEALRIEKLFKDG